MRTLSQKRQGVNVLYVGVFTAFSSQVDASQVFHANCVWEVEAIGDCYAGIDGARQRQCSRVQHETQAAILGSRALVLPGLNRPLSTRVGTKRLCWARRLTRRPRWSRTALLDAST